MGSEFESTLARHRPALLRHCYRMLGSFAEAEDLAQDTLEKAWRARGEYRNEAPLQHWLYTIATNGCLNALSKRKRRAIPQLESAAAGEDFVLGETEPERWLTPAADEQLFPDPSDAAESRESVGLAFVALLQRLPPRQRAALLLKDVLDWKAEQIAEALELSIGSVNSAINRGRENLKRDAVGSDAPPRATLEDFVRAWESRDIEKLVTLLRDDVSLAMPPHAVWFRGKTPVSTFFRSARFWLFWSNLSHIRITSANGHPAFAFYTRQDTGAPRPHSIMVARFVAGRVAEMTVFIGEHNFAGFRFSSG